MNYYNKTAKGYNELHSEEQKAKLDLIKTIIKIKKTDKLLDVGAGTGLSSDFDCDVTAVDPSKELLKQNPAKKKFLANAENIPFKDNSFDIVISITAIHNFKDIEKGLKEIKRTGKNKFVFSVLKKSKKFNLIKKLIKKHFKIQKETEESKDVIFLCSR